MKSLNSPPLSSSGRTAAAAISSPPPDSGLSLARFVAVVGPCALLRLVVLLITPWIGSTPVTWRNVIAGVSPDREIFLIARLPRILFGAIAGGALAVAGVLFQAILRNSLATPFTLGISAGSSFGAVVAIWLGLDVVVAGIGCVSLAAFAGAFLTILLVFFEARSGNALPAFTLLLAGVTLNFIFGALIMIVHYAVNFSQSYMMTRWMMGSLDTADMRSVLRTTPLVIGCVAALIRMAPQ